MKLYGLRGPSTTLALVFAESREHARDLLATQIRVPCPDLNDLVELPAMALEFELADGGDRYQPLPSIERLFFGPYEALLTSIFFPTAGAVMKRFDEWEGEGWAAAMNEAMDVERSRP